MSSRCHFCPLLLSLLKVNESSKKAFSLESQRYHCFPIEMDGIWERKLWHVQKWWVWSEISPSWTEMLRISSLPGDFRPELKTWAGRSRFCSKSSSAGFGTLKYGLSSSYMILSFPPLHILSHVKSQQTRLVLCPVLLEIWDTQSTHGHFWWIISFLLALLHRKPGSVER